MTAASLPSGESRMPSGVCPTTTVSTTRGGLALRSMRLMVSLSPPPRPILATTATEPSRLISSPYGRKPAERSRLVYSTFVPSMASTEMKLSPSRVTSAVLPSGVNAAWLTPDAAGAMVTLLRGVTVLPWMPKTDTVPSDRLATSASVPCRLMLTPAAPAPAWSVLITRGGVALRSTTDTLLSGICLVLSAGSICIAEVTRARPSSGVMATLRGGPTTLVGTGISATTLGAGALRSDDRDGVGRADSAPPGRHH